MKCRACRAYVAALLAMLLLSRDARAGGWVGEDTVLLAELLASHLQEVASLTTIVNNTRQTVAAANDLFALARAAQRTYQMIVNYRLEDLIDDARRGLYRGFPELEALEREIRSGAGNVRAISQGSDAFFTYMDHHDPAVEEAVQSAFSYGFKASIWPMVFPDAMRFHPNPSPAESLVQSHYIYSGERARRAIQQTAMGVMARQIGNLAADAEQKDNSQLRMEALQAEMQFQIMRNTTDLLNLKEIEVAKEEAQRLADKNLAERTQKEITSLADMLGDARRR